MTRAIVVMGVTGAGKSTLARALAEALHWPFVEGDTLHPPANVAKMAAGRPLDDFDRAPFLENVARAIVDARGAGIVVSCSALKRSYRELIRSRVAANGSHGVAGVASGVHTAAGAADVSNNVTFVVLVLDREHLLARLTERRDHFMPPSLVDSQLATLEMPTPDEQVIWVDGGEPTPTQVARVLAELNV